MPDELWPGTEPHNPPDFSQEVTGNAAAQDVVGKLGSILRREREMRNLTLEAVAVRAELSVEHLREVEEGFPSTNAETRRGPTLAKLQRIAEVYDLRVALVRE
jgi:hypothetical protein